MVKDALAEDPPPPEIEIEGVDVYPLPSETIVISDTDPFSIVATAVAGIPQDSDGDAIVTNGADVYPDPPFVTYIFPTNL